MSGHAAGKSAPAGAAPAGRAAPVIAIDGPAGVGKSTVAAALAQSLGLPSLDTGAMFRAVALALGPEGPGLSDAGLALALEPMDFSLSGSGGDSVLFFNGRPVGAEIRTEETGALASALAAREPVRAALLRLQQKIGAATPLVAEGRDMGTVVFPRAACKMFLDAAPEVRAKRRLGDLLASGREVDLDALTRQIEERDRRDRTRAIAPLKPARDALIIDTSCLGLEEVLELALAHAAACGMGAPAGRNGCCRLTRH